MSSNLVFHPEHLYIVPLGGLGEIGKNMMAFLYGNDLVVIDAGVMFPKEEMPGVDFVIPDTQFITDHREKLKGIFLTHGHEDHIGALPYLLLKMDVPVYGTRLTLGLVKGRLREFGLEKKAVLHEINAESKIHLGKISLNFFPNVHSICDGVGVVLETPVGKIVHSGDFKFDQTPMNGMATDFKKLATLGQAEGGVLLLFSDSTYAERPGYSMSEKVVGKSLHQLFARTKGRIIIATFASSLPRIQQVVDVTASYGKKICFMGKSMMENVKIARDLGYLSIPDDLEISADDLNKFPHSRIVIMTTGSQGEPLSVLALMASKSHKFVEIVPGDTVVISATPIPGNEGFVYRTINQIFKQGAEVIYSLTTKQGEPSDSPELKVHVQGHAGQEELKLFLNLIKPRFFVPIHGEYRHLIQHGRLARDVGIPSENIFIAVDGDIIEVTRETVQIMDRLQMQNVFVDGYGSGGIGKSILKERRALSEDGIVVLCIILEKETGRLLKEPELTTKGFVAEDEKEKIMEEAGNIAAKFFQNLQGKTFGDDEVIKGNLKGELNKFFGEKMGRKPIIIPVISWL